MKSDFIADLPDDWWRWHFAATRLAPLFERYLLPLFLDLEQGSLKERRTYTGFLVNVEGAVFWFTAGHIIDSLRDLIEDPGVRILESAWLDRYRGPGGAAIPAFVLAEDSMLSLCPIGLDFGAIALTGNTAELLRANSDVKYFTELAHTDFDQEQPEGYFLVGYPSENVKSEKVEAIPGKASRYTVRYRIECLPIQRLVGSEIPEELPSRYNPGIFHGKILPYQHGFGSQPDSIVGMSGGLLLSIDRGLMPNPHGEGGMGVKYRLVGVQSGWSKWSRIILAESLGRILDALADLSRQVDGLPDEGES